MQERIGESGMRGTGSTDSEMLGDGDSEVGEVDILVFGSSKVRRRACDTSQTLTLTTQHGRLPTSKEGLHLHTKYFTCTAVPEDKTFHIDDTLAINEELYFPVGLASIIEPDALTNICPFARDKLEGTTSDRSTIVGVADGFRCDIANNFVLVIGRRKVGVKFTISASTPHETGREATIITATTRTAHSFFFAIATI